MWSKDNGHTIWNFKGFVLLKNLKPLNAKKLSTDQERRQDPCLVCCLKWVIVLSNMYSKNEKSTNLTSNTLLGPIFNNWHHLLKHCQTDAHFDLSDWANDTGLSFSIYLNVCWY